MNLLKMKDKISAIGEEMEDYSKAWDKYEIGKVKFINRRREHPCRKAFVDFVSKEGFNNILEVGGGELIEAQSILKIKPLIKYYVVDVSKVFLKFSKSIKGVKGYKGNMID